ncbi:unnamed protein product [Symbiodinium pilosum]|uniref:Uncharacterized protein n=1 Tax=Symbiodinium pilosum TaxID=2952 RepID=A0A812YL04_SYMPI|nr:unnamed protein product [Symbiodinium pilosum]
MMKCGKELREAMDALAEASKPDAALIDRIGIVSDTIYSNIDSRITLELVESDDAETIRKDIMELAADLDTVRASPVSKKLEARWEQMRSMHLEKVVKEIAEIVKGTSEVSKLLEALQEIVAKLDALLAGSVTPEIAKRTLVQANGFASAKFLKGFPGLLQKEGPTCLASARDLVAKFDERCTKLAAAAAEESSWQLQLPEVEKLIQQVGLHMVKVQLQQSGAEFAQENFDAAYNAFAALHRWWPLCQGGDLPAELLDGFSKVAELATERVTAASGKGQEMMDFALKLDALGTLPGWPEGGVAGRLGAAAYEAPLSGLTAEMKEPSGSAKTMVSFVESLSSAAEKIPADQAERIQGALSQLEEVLLARAEAQKTDELEEVAAAATSYDEARLKLTLLGESKALLPRLKESICRTSLQRAEEELSKESGLNPALVLELVKRVGHYNPGSVDDLRSSLQSVTAKTSQRMCDSFQTAVAASQYPKIKGLLKFAESFDSVVAAAGCESSVEAELKKIQEAAVFEEPAEPDAPGEVETPEAVATVKAKLEEVEAMLAQERGMNPNVILKNLTEIVPLWPAAESPELSDRLVTAFNTLKTRMSAACAAASREDQEAKLKALMAFAHKMDEAQRSLGSCCTDFLLSMAVAGASQDLLDAESELGKESGMNPMLVLKNISSLRIYWEVLGPSEEAVAAEQRQRLGAMCDLMRSRITSSYEEHPEKRPNLLKFSGAFDTAIQGLAGAGEAKLASELQAKG